MRSGRITVAALAALLSLGMAACANDEDQADGANESPEPSEPPDRYEPPADPTVTVEDSDLGQILVDAEGRTLYVFLADEGAESTCYDECEASWPPLTIEGDPAAGEGVDDSVLGTTEREDGSTQVTIDGHPLYHFAADETADDVNGQGVGDVWFVVSPAGEPIQG